MLLSLLGWKKLKIAVGANAHNKNNNREYYYKEWRKGFKFFTSSVGQFFLPPFIAADSVCTPKNEKEGRRRKDGVVKVVLEIKSQELSSSLLCLRRKVIFWPLFHDLGLKTPPVKKKERKSRVPIA